MLAVGIHAGRSQSFSPTPKSGWFRTDSDPYVHISVRYQYDAGIEHKKGHDDIQRRSVGDHFNQQNNANQKADQDLPPAPDAP